MATTKTNMLITFCNAQRDFEGGPGDRNYRNNNPGNFKYSPVGYLAKYGAVKKDKDGFAIFPTFELGTLYHRNFVLAKALKHPDWDIHQYVYAYAPVSDDNPNNENYVAHLAAACGVPATAKLSDLFL